LGRGRCFLGRERRAGQFGGGDRAVVGGVAAGDEAEAEAAGAEEAADEEDDEGGGDELEEAVGVGHGREGGKIAGVAGGRSQSLSLRSPQGRL